MNFSILFRIFTKRNIKILEKNYNKSLFSAKRILYVARTNDALLEELSSDETKLLYIFLRNRVQTIHTNL